MNDADAKEQPSMEEILASIRKIISEDVEENPNDEINEELEPLELMDDADEELEPLELMDDADEELEPLELMDDADEELEPLELTDDADEELEPLELTDDADEDPVELITEEKPLEIIEEDAEEIEVDMMVSEDEPKNDIELIDDNNEEEKDVPLPPSSPLQAFDEKPVKRIISNQTAAAGTASFAHLENTIRMGNMGNTMEDIVKQMLQPMLRGWLDENLPPLVERLVQDEIRKMAGIGKRTHNN